MKLSDQAIKQIAEELDSGMICYIHQETKEVKPMINFEENYFADTEFWEEDLKEIEENWDQYIRIEKMSSQEGFQIMEDFAEQVSDYRIQDKLFRILSRSKPFRNFKYEIDHYEKLRLEWFAFKQERYEQWVRKNLEAL